MVSGRKLAELGDGGGNNVQSKIDIGLRGVAAEAEAQAGTRFFGRQTNGREDVRWLHGPGRAGCAGGTREPLQVEGDEERFAFDARENKIRGVWRARRSASVHAGLRDASQEALLELVTEGA